MAETRKLDRRLHDTATAAALDDFHNRLRIMVGIDMHELVEAGAIAANDRNAWNPSGSIPTGSSSVPMTTPPRRSGR